MGGRELLLILDAASAGDLLGHLGEAVRVMHRMPHVVVLRGSDEALAQVAARPGVTRAVERGTTPPVLSELSEGERLFVRGWLAGSTSKEHPGEGLAWDAPGYTPPG
jgi:hypothetical protein